MKCSYLLGRYFVPIKDYSMGTNDNTIHASASMAQGLIHSSCTWEILVRFPAVAAPTLSFFNYFYKHDRNCEF